jgi:hypothetical protein
MTEPTCTFRGTNYTAQQRSFDEHLQNATEQIFMCLLPQGVFVRFGQTNFDVKKLPSSTSVLMITID